MILSKLHILVMLTMVVLSAASHAETFDLNYDRLKAATGTLNNVDQGALGDSIQLIKSGEHTLALARLSALNKSNPKNSSLRILASYALLQAGNLVGAFEEAEKAHAAPDGNSYKCWFLAKVALLSGNKVLCERELKHVHSAGDMVAEAKALEAELSKN